MFSKLMIRQVAFRIYVMKFVGGAYYDWDYKNNRVCKSHNFFYWTFINHTIGGYAYSFIMFLQQYLAAYGYQEEPQSTATTIIGVGEALTTTCICLLCTAMCINRDLLINLMNEMIEYDRKLMELLTSDGRVLSKRHKIEMHAQEVMMFLLNLFTLVLPALIITVFAHPIEPTRRMLMDWFEIEIELQLRWIPVLMIFYILLIAAGNGAVVLCILVDIYFSVCTNGILDMQPQQLDKKENFLRIQNKFITRSLGVKSDDELIVMFRIQDLLNRYLNKIEGNLMISFHNVACIGAVVSMAYFALAHADLLRETGVIGYLVVFGAISAPLFLQLVEAEMFGKICNISDDFIETGKALVWRKSKYKKFLRTCRTFYVEQAYPFYHIHKETFLAFCEACLGYILDLLLA